MAARSVIGSVSRTRFPRTWNVSGKGMRAEFMPPELQFEPNVQDPHLVAQASTNPDVLWVQHHKRTAAAVRGRSRIAPCPRGGRVGRSPGLRVDDWLSVGERKRR